MAFDDVVVLVPGFLGLSRIGGFYDFAERIAAALRCALESKTVVPSFHSGAGFRDDQFYALYRRVVEVLAPQMARA